MSDRSKSYDVIVTGAGPVGQTLAIDLGWRGIKCLLLERNATTAPGPRWTAPMRARWSSISVSASLIAFTRVAYPPEIPMDVFIVTRLCDPPLAVLRYPSVAGVTTSRLPRVEMARCRLEDRQLDYSLRPRSLTEFIGQQRIKQVLGMSIEAARRLFS